MKFMREENFDPRIAIAELSSTAYPEASEGDSTVAEALHRVASELDWAAGDRGPFGNVIPAGARVLIKPNFVTHRNEGPWGIEPLVTHQSLVRAAVEGALRADPAEVLVGDAPMQACDFDQLLDATGLGVWARELAGADPRFRGIHDLRRTTCTFLGGVRVASENLRPEEQFVLFDLGADSLLEPITDGRNAFRVTCYDPKLLAKTHAPGRHQYLVSRAVMEADVVINLPKLKTHKKAGITCGLKNLVGINGNKEYLPHHRVGGAGRGGDCYPGASLVKRARERVADEENMTASLVAGRFWHGVGAQLDRLLRIGGDQLGIEGSWSGNDTVWRMALDLNRVLLYGRPDACLSLDVQRRVIHLVDAIVAGQGDGPLAPRPLPLGLILAGNNAAAMDFVGARLLGYDPERIPIVREAFEEFSYPLAMFGPEDVVLTGDLGHGAAMEVLRSRKSQAEVIHPSGWRDAGAVGTPGEELWQLGHTAREPEGFKKSRQP